MTRPQMTQMDADGNPRRCPHDGFRRRDAKSVTSAIPTLASPIRDSAVSSHLRPSASICGRGSSVRLQRSAEGQLDHDRQRRGEESAAVPGVGAAGSSMRSSSSIPAARTGPARSPGSSGRRCSISRGSTTSPRRGTRPCRMPRAITPSGSMPTTWSSRPEREKLAGGSARVGLTGLGRAEAAAYVVRCACDPSPDGTGGETVVDHIRLFPLRDDVRWTYRVHEQILPALRRAGIPVRWTDLIVRHTGYADPALRARKLERDIRHPSRGAEGPARRSVHPVQPGRDRHRAARTGARRWSYLRGEPGDARRRATRSRGSCSP